MPDAAYEVIARIRIDDQLSRHLTDIEARLRQIGGLSSTLGLSQMGTGAASAMEGAARSAGGLMAGLRGIASTAASVGVALMGLQAAGNAIGFLQDSMVGFNARLEQTRIAFTNMLGPDKGESLIAQMKRFAAITPFRLEEVERAGRLILAMGFSAEQVIPMLRDVGNAVAAMGGGGVEIERVVLNLGQMAAQGKVTSREMRDLAMLGLPVWQMLADHIGMTVAETQKLAEQGELAYDVFYSAFSEFVRARYGDMMARQAETFSGAMTTIADSVQMAIADAFQPLFRVLSQAAVGISRFVQGEEWEAWATRVRAGTELAIEEVGKFLTGLYDIARQAFSAGWELVSSYAQGILDGYSSVLSEVISWVTQQVASFLIGQSPPPQGPLSQVIEGGRALIEAWTQGMAQGDLSNVVRIAQDIAENLKNGFEDLPPELEGLPQVFRDARDRAAELGDQLSSVNSRLDAVRQRAQDIRDAYDAQERALRRQLDLLKPPLDMERERQRIALQQREDQLQLQLLAAKGDKAKEEELRKELEAVRAQQEQLRLTEDLERLNRRLLELPIEQQIEEVRRKRDAALEPLQQEERELAQQQKLLSDQKRQWDEVTASIRSALSTLQQVAKAQEPKGGGGGGGHAAAPLNVGRGIAESIEGAKGEIAQKAREALEGAKAAVRDWWEKNKPVLASMAAGAILGGVEGGPLGAALGAAIGAIFGTTVLPKLREKFTELAPQLSVIGDRLSGVPSRAAEAWGQVMDVIGRLRAALEETFSPKILATAEGLSLLPEKLEPVFRRLLSSIQEFGTRMGPVFNTLVSMAGIVGAIIGAVLGGVLMAVLAALPGLLEGLANVFAGAFTVIMGVLEVFGGIVQAILGPIIPLLKGDIPGALEQMRQGWETVTDGVGKILSGLELAVVGGLGKVVGAAIDAGANFVSGFVRTLADIADVAVGKDSPIARLLHSVDTELGKLPSMASSVASGMINALVSGIRDGATRVANAVTGVVGGAISAAKKMLGIESPSRVFMELGRLSAAGYYAGLNQALTQQPLALTPSSTTNQYYRSMNVQIHADVRSPLDERALIHTLMSHLERLS